MANRPLPSSKNPHFQTEARCTTLLAKMSFICMRMKNDFQIKGCAPTLVLKQRPGGTRKWPIGLQSTITHFARDTESVLCRIAPWACFGTLTPLWLTTARLRRRLGQNLCAKQSHNAVQHNSDPVSRAASKWPTHKEIYKRIQFYCIKCFVLLQEIRGVFG